MVRSIERILGYGFRAEDGRIGHVHDVLFDDVTWMVRYVVADTGNWLPGRKVLLSPLSLGAPRWSDREIPVELTKKHIEESPPIATDSPVSRQEEERIHLHFQWEPYWLGQKILGPLPVGRPGAAAADDPNRASASRDPHLRSVREVVGYHIDAEDGEIGHVEDFLVNGETWGLKWLVVDTRNWLPGKKVLVSPLWILGVDWMDRLVRVDLKREQVENGPEWNPRKPVDAEYVRKLFDSYGRPVPDSELTPAP